MLSFRLAKRKLLLLEANSYVGAREYGPNRGALVEMFQKDINDTIGHAWCMSFVQYCLNKVDAIYKEIELDSEPHHIFPSEHCMTVYKHTTSRVQKPYPGCIVIWKHGDTTNGHTGIVDRVNADGTFITVEGNTNGAGSREGDGVYKKIRHFAGDGDLRIVGFLEPWP